MKNPPILALILCLCLLAVGCASTQQTMTPPAGTVSLTLAGPSGPIAPEAQAYRQGPVIVVIGCQIGVTAKPVGLDILNPAASIAAQQNSGTSGSAATAGNVQQIKPSVLPAADPFPAAVDKTEDPAKPTPAPEVATPVAVEATTAAEDHPAAPSGGG